jgi:hypothetical protein
MNLSPETTLEDILNYKKEEIKTYLKSENLKVSGSKHELAIRAFEHNQLEPGQTALQIVTDTPSLEGTSKTTAIPSITELTDGWFSDFLDTIDPPVTQNDIENYLLKSSNRTCDNQKMACFRQYIQGHKFCKENYIHKIMVNRITDDHPMCYVRSKCHASMKKEIYTQWVVLSKQEPMTIHSASCTCPAG